MANYSAVAQEVRQVIHQLEGHGLTPDSFRLWVKVSLDKILNPDIPLRDPLLRQRIKKALYGCKHCSNVCVSR